MENEKKYQQAWDEFMAKITRLKKRQRLILQEFFISLEEKRADEILKQIKSGDRTH